MEFEKQKQISDEYRQAWERVFGEKKLDSWEYPIFSRPVASYPNGCPILEDKSK